MASLGVGAFLLVRTTQDARSVIDREERARVAVRALWDAEKAFRASRRLDANHNGAAEFGALEDLAAAGLLRSALVTDAEGTYLPGDGYRLEVLLPERLDAGGHRLFARPPDRPDPRLAEVCFAAMARPAPGGPKALRTFYLDADQRAYVAEGVYDPDRDPSPPPPRVELHDAHEDTSNEGPIWRRAPFPAPDGSVPPEPPRPR